jgi:hypothetical protein
MKNEATCFSKKRIAIIKPEQQDTKTVLYNCNKVAKVEVSSPITVVKITFLFLVVQAS